MDTSIKAPVWLVMQSLKYHKWVLAVMYDEFARYRVTEIMSDNPDIIVQYADYLNKGKIGSSMDHRCCTELERLRERYVKELSCN